MSKLVYNRFFFVFKAFFKTNHGFVGHNRALAKVTNKVSTVLRPPFSEISHFVPAGYILQRLMAQIQFTEIFSLFAGTYPYAAHSYHMSPGHPDGYTHPDPIR